MINLHLNDLYSIAERDGIDVQSFKLSSCECLSFKDDDGNCYIAIDPFELENTFDEKAKLAHELGHCETGSFYNEYSAFDIRAKHEHRADVWAIKKLVPKDELIAAINSGCANRFELSEYFELPESFIQKALDYYFDV